MKSPAIKRRLGNADAFVIDEAADSGTVTFSHSRNAEDQGQGRSRFCRHTLPQKCTAKKRLEKREGIGCFPGGPGQELLKEDDFEEVRKTSLFSCCRTKCRIDFAGQRRPVRLCQPKMDGCPHHRLKGSGGKVGTLGHQGQQDLHD